MKRDFILVISDELSPSLTNKTTHVFKSSLKENFNVIIINSNKFCEIKINSNSIIWPYYRNHPKKNTNDDILKCVNKKVTVINNYNKHKFDHANKVKVIDKVNKAGIKVPYTIEVKSPRDLLSKIKYPIVIKGFPSGQGKDVFLCNNYDDLIKKYNLLLERKKKILIQEYIAKSHGRDLRILVFKGEILNFFERRSETNWKSNISTGGKIIEYKIGICQYHSIKKTIRLFKDLDFFSIDFLFYNNQLVLNEINTAPGWSNKLFFSPFNDV